MFTAKVVQNIKCTPVHNLTIEDTAKKKRQSKPNYALDNKYKLPIHNLTSKKITIREYTSSNCNLKR